MKKPVLVIMAAGMGSRYGGLKQIDPIGPSGEFIIDYSIYDAIAAGFDKALARDVFHKPLVVLLVFPEKLVGERFDVKRRLDVVQFDVARLAKELAEVVGHGAAALIGPEQEGVTLAVGKGIVCGLAAK